MMSRRTFVRCCVAATTLTIGSAAAKPTIESITANKACLRPPGSLPEKDFLARCLRCYRCISACPTNVLEPAPLESGILAVRTPQLNFSNASCTFCDLCRQVCPTECMNFANPINQTTERDIGWIGIAIIHANRCLAYVNSSCGVCADACEWDAIGLDELRRPIVDSKKCNGCGECVKVCPANVLRSYDGQQLRGVEVVLENKQDGAQ
ncbi:MAG: 4Fe-4S dicluster domain-containing protein [Coriobacteriales bacterium]|jgi:ferredoxin-type protein NapG|nr:4Fe-4S dicluster domain-containing protein [Coriobacteriales bacterium]